MSRTLKNLVLASSIALAPISAGCGGEAQGIDVPVEILDSNVEGMFSADGRIVRTAQITLRLGDRPSRTFQLEAIRTVFKGEGDEMLAITDTTDGTSALYAINDEDSSAAISNVEGNLELRVNPDESIEVDGTTFTEPGLAAAEVLTSPAVSSLSPEAMAAADVALDYVPEVDGTTPAGKGFVKKAVKRFVRWILKNGIWIGIECNGNVSCSPCVGKNSSSNYCY